MITARPTSAIWHDETGATAIEYGLIAALIAVALAGVMMSLGDKVETQYEGVGDKYSEAANN
ncbi:Flp family type IVb pilin [Aurantiacibacter spongiae]|uniref:Flp family type IVb pilin n=1 Tax=Aurantiacibacter spongiae TaxID=2488860 RepID=A0A3N5DFY3_9SPHN|nr:Flp family type IVb pilin [Aurantiacibacter spongiae]RPF70572.1 Flp family type IVb pilin [Aurantiacibacter spongiae]